MQDPATLQPIKPQFLEQEQLKCPRCESTNTKFCYFNNYNLSQPCHFCKNFQSGGSRKNTKRSSNPKQSSSSLATSNSSLATHNPDPQPELTQVYGSPIDHDRRMMDVTGTFSSLLTSGQFGGLLEALNSNGSGLKMVQLGELGERVNSGAWVATLRDNYF
ncbi:hypothetical protein UlMin_035418 [Ulmus minor]